MPTTKQRITITATGELERILAVEQRRHPELSPSALVALLVKRGHEAGTTDRAALLVRQLAGGVAYPVGHLDELRSEWPD